MLCKSSDQMHAPSSSAPRPIRPIRSSQPGKASSCSLPASLESRRVAREKRDRPWVCNSVLAGKPPSKPEDTDKPASMPEVTHSFGQLSVANDGASTTVSQPSQQTGLPSGSHSLARLPRDLVLPSVDGVLSSSLSAPPSRSTSSSSSFVSSPPSLSSLSCRVQKPTRIPSPPPGMAPPGPWRPHFLTKLGLAFGRVRALTRSKIPAPVRRVSPEPIHSLPARGCLKATSGHAGGAQHKKKRVAFDLEANETTVFQRYRDSVDFSDSQERFWTRMERAHPKTYQEKMEEYELDSALVRAEREWKDFTRSQRRSLQVVLETLEVRELLEAQEK